MLETVGVVFYLGPILPPPPPLFKAAGAHNEEIINFVNNLDFLIFSFKVYFCSPFLLFLLLLLLFFCLVSFLIY